MNERQWKTTSGVEARAPRRTRAQRGEVVAAYRASGLTQAQYAAQAGLKLATLRGWIYRPPRASERVGFASVQLRGPTPGVVTLRWLRPGVEVELAVDLDGTSVVRLVRDLLAPCLQ
jgi:hypothetical protein